MKSIAIVFIPGIKGSRLLTDTHQLRWLGLKQVFNLDRKPLYGNERLFPHGVLERILWESVYAPFLRLMRQRTEHFFIFSYDWRAEGLIVAEELLQFVRDIHAQHGPVLLIAHSLGGFISLPVVRSNPDLFHAALFAGSPFGTGIDFARDMHQGTRVGLNKRILSYDAHFSWFSPYLFFPLDTENDRIVDRYGHTVAHDWYDPLSWERLNLSIFQKKLSWDQLSKARQHLQYALNVAKTFRQEVCRTDQVSASAMPPLAVLAGKHQPTLAQLICQVTDQGHQWDFQNGVKTPGDGRVEFTAAMLPDNLNAQVFTSNYGHGQLLNDISTVDRILSTLINLNL